MVLEGTARSVGISASRIQIDDQAAGRELPTDRPSSRIDGGPGGILVRLPLQLHRVRHPVGQRHHGLGHGGIGGKSSGEAPALLPGLRLADGGRKGSA